MSNDPPSNEYDIDNVSGTAFAIGTGATGQINIHTTPQQEDLKALLAEFRREVEAHKNELEDPDALTGSADLVEREVESEQPNAGAARTLLSAMVAGAGNVASVLEVAVRLEQAAEALFWPGVDRSATDAQPRPR